MIMPKEFNCISLPMIPQTWLYHISTKKGIIPSKQPPMQMYNLHLHKLFIPQTWSYLNPTGNEARSNMILSQFYQKGVLPSKQPPMQMYDLNEKTYICISFPMIPQTWLYLNPTGNGARFWAQKKAKSSYKKRG